MLLQKTAIRPRPQNAVPRRRIVVRAIGTDLVESSYYLGKAIVYGVFFYSTWKWWYYRDLRKKYEEDNDEKK
jgi:hypothetical protein